VRRRAGRASPDFAPTHTGLIDEHDDGGCIPVRDVRRNAMIALEQAMSGLPTRVLLAVALGALACSSKSPSAAPSGGEEKIGAAEPAPGAVLTQHNDNARTGAILSETVLNTKNVNKQQFGKKASLHVRGSVTAQPLYVPKLNIAGATHDVVYIATMHNFVYAFPADGSSTAPLWGPVSLCPPISLPDPAIGGGEGYRDTSGEIGIVSTPVISPDLNALFVVATCKEEGRFYHRLQRLELTTGEKGSQVEIQATGFVSELENQRSSLLLSNHTLYVAFAAYGDQGAYRGFMFGYDTETLSDRSQPSVFRTTESGSGGGIWMAGQGPAADADGNVYAITGNGPFNDNAPEFLTARDLSESFIKLSDQLTLQSWFSPANNAYLNDEDGDLGASGAMLLPNTNIVLGAGKEGKFYLLERSGLGYFDSTQDDQQAGVLQRFFAAQPCQANLSTPDCHHVHGSPVYWDGPKGPRIYVWPENDYAKAFQFDASTGRVDCGAEGDPLCAAISVSKTRDPEDAPGGTRRSMPGGFLSLSANGKTEGTGILWGLHPYQGNANQDVREGILRAYDASDLEIELWNSKQEPARDDVGRYAKTAAPTVANGSVFVPSFTGPTHTKTLTEKSKFSPALVARQGSSDRKSSLYLGWTEADGHLSIESTSDGLEFSAKTPLSQTSSTGPTLAASGSALYLGFVTADNHVKVLRSTDGFMTTAPMDGLDGTGPATIASDAPASNAAAPEKSGLAPALTASGDRVFLAWTAEDGELTLISGASTGLSFDPSSKVIVSERSTAAPSLAYESGRVYIAWLDPDARINVAYSVDDGHTFTKKQPFDDKSNSGPRIVSLGAGGTDPDLFLFWTQSNRSLNVKTSDDATVDAFRYKFTFPDTTSSAPAAAVFNQRVFLGWTNADGALSVSPYSTGEISVYGLL